MNLLDWLLLLLVAAYALSGYWQGFITGAFATAGLLAGGLFGIWLAPLALGDAERKLWVSLAALFIVVLCATLGQAFAQYGGARMRARIRWQPARSLDAIGGALLSSAAVLLVAWALGVAITGSRLGPVTPIVRESRVLAEVDRVLPDQAYQGLQAFNEVVGTSYFPRYLEPFQPERIVAVDKPDPAIKRDPQVVAAGRSVFKVYGNNDCGRGVEGTAFLVAPDRVMTNAHVVAGVDNPQVEIGGDSVEATTVLYDEDLDIAVLAIPAQDRPVLAFEPESERNDSEAVLGYPQDGPYDVQAVRIRDDQRLRSPDIYGNGSVLRDVYSLRGLIRPGNSGGPMVNADGEVTGVIFAASVSDPDTGYALQAAAVLDARDTGMANDARVSTEDCA